MTTFLNAQLDFILFFYGLAFILLGVVCFAIARGPGHEQAWAVLGMFGLIHGASEWLDLVALLIGNHPLFAIMRTVIMTTSFFFLMEFARHEAKRLGRPVPGRWIYIPLILLVAIGGAVGGPSVANAFSRYFVALPGAMATSFVFIWWAKSLSHAERRFAVLASAGFALYAIAAGLVVPTAPVWPANSVNQTWFSQTTGMPIQLARAVLACGLAFSIWGISGEKLIREVSSTRYTNFLKKQFVWTLVAVATILISGWMLTEYLGDVYEKNVRDETRGELTLLTGRLAEETAAIDAMAQVLAGSPTVKSFLAGQISPDNDDLKSMLILTVEASRADVGHLLSATGAVIAKYARASRPRLVPHAPELFTQWGNAASHHFAFNPTTKMMEYHARSPVYAPGGDVSGAALLQKSLVNFKDELGSLGQAYFVVDPDGIVALTNRPDSLLRPMWPLSSEMQHGLTRSVDGLNSSPMLPQKITSASWTTLDNEQVFVRRSYLGDTQWSLVILTPLRGIFASRVLGIAITLLTTIVALTYIVGRERTVHDHVQMDRRLELEEQTRDLDFRATTDPLTGLCNRFKFNQVLAQEMVRSERYNTSLSLILYDVDHFKEVNDTYGHLVGDEVLIELSRFVSGRIRRTDLLARWGGEEFVILAPESDGQGAYEFARDLATALSQLENVECGAVTCSFGIAQFVAGDTAATFIARADDALYRAKINGRNRAELAKLSQSEAGCKSVA